VTTVRLDGNAIAATLVDVFGEEMTTASGSCAWCGRLSQLAEAIVYLPAPGIVARCPRCEGILLVIIQRRGRACVDLNGFVGFTNKPG
jgi:hypothetical protein